MPTQKPMLAVGVDPAKRVHRAVAVLFPDDIVLDVELPNAVHAIESLDDRLADLALAHCAELVYGLEDHRRYGRLFAQVLARRGRDMRVVNPLWTDRQRAFYGQDKDDAIDGRSIAAVVLRRQDELPHATEYDEIAQAVREAERTIQDLGEKRTQLINRLHLQLSDVYTAAYENYFGKLKSPISLRFFGRFPLPQDLAGHNAAMLGSSLLDLAGGRVGPHKAGRRLEVMCAKAQNILDTSAEMRQVPRSLALELKAELIRQLCDELLAVHERVRRLERMLRNQLLPVTGQTIDTISGIGDILAATIVGEIGSINRFRSPAAFAVYNGTAPARNSTGGRDRHKARHDCNHRLKRAFWLAARAAVRHDDLAKAYFERCKQRGLGYAECVKRVARRMSDMVYAMLKSGRTGPLAPAAPLPAPIASGSSAARGSRVAAEFVMSPQARRRVLAPPAGSTEAGASKPISELGVRAWVNHQEAGFNGEGSPVGNLRLGHRASVCEFEGLPCPWPLRQ